MAVTCRLTGLYLVLIVTLLMSMGIFGVQMLEVALEAPQARALGKAIGTASQWLSVCPRLTWEGIACSGLHTRPGELLWNGGRDCLCLKLWVLPFPEAITKQISRSF